MTKDYYDILGIPQNTSKEDTKRAYHILAHQFHPDKADGNEKRFKEINEAYRVLSGEKSRAEYDRQYQPKSHTEKEGGGEKKNSNFQKFNNSANKNKRFFWVFVGVVIFVVILIIITNSHPTDPAPNITDNSEVSDAGSFVPVPNINNIQKDPESTLYNSIVTFKNDEISNPEYLKSPNDFSIDNPGQVFFGASAHSDPSYILPVNPGLDKNPLSLYVEKAVSVNRFVVSYVTEVNNQKVLVVKDLTIDGIWPFSSDPDYPMGNNPQGKIWNTCQYAIQKDFPRNLILHKYIIANNQKITVDGQDLLTIMTQNGLGIFNTEIGTYMVNDGYEEYAKQLQQNIDIAKLAKKGIWSCGVQ